jgi:DNA-binding response OmpR family regulator
MAILFLGRRQGPTPSGASLPSVLDTAPLYVLAVTHESWLRMLLDQGERQHMITGDRTDSHDAALALAASHYYDVILMEHVAGYDSIELCRRLRNEGVATPVLVTAAHGTVGDVVAGLDAGADNFLVGAIDYTELLARLRVVRRRHEGRLAPLNAPRTLACSGLPAQPTQERPPVTIDIAAAKDSDS